MGRLSGGGKSKIFFLPRIYKKGRVDYIYNDTGVYLVSTISRACYILQAERQLLKLAKNTNAKKEDDEVYFEDEELALAA